MAPATGANSQSVGTVLLGMGCDAAAFEELFIDEMVIVLRRDGHIGPDEVDSVRAELLGVLRQG